MNIRIFIYKKSDIADSCFEHAGSSHDFINATLATNLDS